MKNFIFLSLAILASNVRGAEQLRALRSTTYNNALDEALASPSNKEYCRTMRRIEHAASVNPATHDLFFKSFFRDGTDIFKNQQEKALDLPRLCGNVAVGFHSNKDAYRGIRGIMLTYANPRTKAVGTARADFPEISEILDAQEDEAL